MIFLYWAAGYILCGTITVSWWARRVDASPEMRQYVRNLVRRRLPLVADGYAALALAAGGVIAWPVLIAQYAIYGRVFGERRDEEER